MKQRDTLDKIVNYLVNKTTLTLCCADQDEPYCCNCFYVLDRVIMALYITSSLNTHHANIMINNPNVAGTVSDQVASITHLQGVQYQGYIRLLTDDDEEQARRLFSSVYPIAKLKPAPMWEIIIDRLKMTDNHLRFGKKLYWSRYD